MKKFTQALLTMLLILQVFVPQWAIAQTNTENDSIQLDALSVAPESTKEAVQLKVKLTTATTKEKTATLTISSGVQLENTTTGTLEDSKKVQLGTYQVKDNAVQLTLSANSPATVTFTLKGKIPAGSKVKQVTGTLGGSVQTAVLPDSWFSETTDSSVTQTTDATTSQSSSSTTTTTDSTPATTETTTAEKPAAPKRAPMNISDIYSDLNMKDDFLTSMNLSYTDQNGQVVTNPTIDDRINFQFNFALSEAVREKIEAGDYYTFTLPDTVTVSQNQTYPLTDKDGNHYADVTIDTDGKVTVTFTDEVKNASDITGDFHFTGEFNKDNIDGPGNVVIVPPGHEDLGGNVVIKPNYTGDNIDKKGHFDKEQNPDKIIWDVDINKALDTLENTSVTEQLPAGTTFDSVKVYKVTVDFDGNVVEGSETLVDPSEYTVDANGGVHFKNTIDEAYRLEYTTTIDEDTKPTAGGLASFTNHATLSSKDLPDASTEASVSTTYGKEISKSKGNYNANEQTIDWNLEYNYGEKVIKNGTITDTFQDPNMYLIDQSVELYEVTFATDGSPIRGKKLVEGVDYTLTDKGNGLEIKFIGDVTTAVDVTYSTGYKGILDENVTINNAVVTESGEHDGDSGNLTPQNIIKKLGNVDYTNHTVAWSFDVNKNHYSMNNWHLSDSFTAGLTLKTDTMKIYDNEAQKELVLGTDYTLDYDEANNTFEIVFIGNYVKTDHSFKITYVTDYDPDSVPATDPDKQFTNTGKVEWTTDDGKTITDEDSADFKPNDPTKYNGAKSGSYNAETKQITWTIAVNYSDKDLENAKLTDPIPTDQNYVWGSAKAYHYTVASDGSIVKGSELTPAEYKDLGLQQPDASNGKTLIIDFPDNTSGTYLIEYKTSVDGSKIHHTYTNDAVFSNDKYEDHTLHGEVSVNHGDEFTNKSGKQDQDGYVNWQVTLNGSQSTLYDVTVVDTPSPNQSIALDSLHLYGTKVDASGNITIDKSKELVKDQDYTVDLVTDNVTGQQKMTIHFINSYQQIDTAYMMEYKSMVFLEGNKGTVSNNINISSIGKTEIDENGSGSTEVTVSEGGGSTSGHRGQLTLKKVDESGKVLPEGATFELWDRNNTQMLRSGTVGKDGLITFGNLPFGKYILKETGTLTNLGYTIDQELVDGKTVEVNQSTTDGTPVTIKNNLSEVKLIKKDETGERLIGATFKLEVLDPITNMWVPKTVSQSLVTNNRGELIIKGLTPGSYRLIEIIAPDGYILNTNAVPFEVVENSDHQLIQVGMTEAFVNFKGSVHFIKKDADGKPLAGAVFGLYEKGDLTTPVAKETSGADGSVTFTNIAPGEYVIKEISSPNGYVLNTESLGNIVIPETSDKPLATIELSQGFTNYKGSAKIVKYGNATDGRHLLTGVEFALEDANGNVVASGATDGNGEFLAEELAPGTYYFVETSVGPNHQYLLNTEKVKVVVSANSEGKPATVTAEMNDYQGAFEIKKVNGNGDALAGAVFDLYDAGKNLVASNLTSDANGMIYHDGVAPGKYYLVEKKAPINPATGQEYVKNEYPIWVTIEASHEGKPETIELGEFQNFKGKVSFTKVGAGSQPIAGAKFRIFKAVNGNEQQVVNVDGKDYIEVGADGHLDIDPLGPGYYKIVEISAPTGYVVNMQPMYFTVKEGEQQMPPIENIEIINYEISIDARKVDDSKPLPQGLAGAVFEIKNAAGKPASFLNEKGEKVTTVTSDATGKIFAKGLGAGDYTLVEVKAPNGYVVSETGTPFTIKETQGEPEHITIHLGNIVNHQGGLHVRKENEAGKPLNGGTFEVRDASGKAVEVTDQLGLKTTKLTAVAGWITANGLVPGSYYLVETKAPDGYIQEADQKIMPFVIPTQETATQKLIFTGNFVNYQGSITLTKQDQQTKNPLAGATFTLYWGNGQALKTNLISQTDGKITVSDLAPGTYYFVETKAPDGYQLSTQKTYVTIADEAVHKPKTVQVSMTNTQLPAEPKPNEEKPAKPKNPFGMFGEKNNLIYYVIGLILLAVVIVSVLWRRNKAKNN